MSVARPRGFVRAFPWGSMRRDGRTARVTIFGTPIAPEGVNVRNLAFDVTPARYVEAIITERGIARSPYDASLRALRDS